ncbi:MAG: D-alanyl-D-alanine carboxypeptidase [Patescibacteria group bacterium]|nr:serine hydrolase [Patescibacteria group bacterium]MDE1965935.1 D-alanyl-D-alanine carboxypeptidase [Patescibacteria group bacterium]
MDLKSDFAALKESIIERREQRKLGFALVAACAVLALTLLDAPPSAPAPASAPAGAAAQAAPDPYANLPLDAKAAVVYDLTDNRVLYSKNDMAQLPLASVTKLLTVYAAVHELGLSAPVTLTPDDIATEGNSGLKAGETLTLGDLARFSLVISSNDGAHAMARVASERAGVPDASFLTAAAAAADLPQMYAIDGSGLDISTDVSGGYGSALDVAELAGKLLTEAPSIAAATTHETFTVRSAAGVPHTAINTNPYVTALPGLLLSKTGYTDLAGGNLAVVLDVGMNHPVAIVALGSTEKSRFTDVNTLAAATFSYFATHPAD